MVDRVASRLLIASPIVVILGVVTLWLNELGTGEYWAAVGWYARDQVGQNPLFWPLAALVTVTALAWGVVALREEWLCAHDSGGALPRRHLGVVDERTLVRRARALLQPELSRFRPRIERSLDALLGAMVDLGASELRLEPGEGHSDVVLVVGMDKLSVMRIGAELHQALVNRLTVMLALPKQEGRGAFKLRSGDAVEQIEVLLRSGDGGVGVKLQLASRARPALTLARLGLPEDDLERLRPLLQADRGLIAVCASPRHGATTTLYASGHYIHHTLGYRAGKISLLEPHVSLGVPFMHQAETGGLPLAAVLKRSLRGGFAVLLLRSVEDRETARLAVEAARSRLVVMSLEVDDIAEGLQRLAQWVGVAPLQATLGLSLGQRLLPRLCPHCRVQGPLTERQRGAIGELDGADELYHSVGGDCCDGRGERGVYPLFWSLDPEPWLFEGLAADSAAEELRRAAQRAGHGGALLRAVEAARRGDISANTLAKLAQQGMC